MNIFKHNLVAVAATHNVADYFDAGLAPQSAARRAPAKVRVQLAPRTDVQGRVAAALAGLSTLGLGTLLVANLAMSLQMPTLF